MTHYADLYTFNNIQKLTEFNGCSGSSPDVKHLSSMYMHIIMYVHTQVDATYVHMYVQVHTHIYTVAMYMVIYIAM